MMTMRTLALAATIVAVLAGPAAARCSQPYAPIIKINANATKEEVASLRSDIVAFISASDLYQSCLVAQRANQELLDANQAQKERVGREFNAAMHARKPG